VNYVEELLKRGYASSAEATLREALVSPSDVRPRLLALLADALAPQSYDPNTFAKTETAAMLRPLSDTSDIGAGVRELLLLHAAPQPRRDAYSWWTRGYHPEDPSGPRGPTVSLRRLARQLADTLILQGDTDSLRRAAPYAELAVELSGSSIDPRSVLTLAEIYADTGQNDKLAAISDRYVKLLFQGKNDAYATANDQQIYEFHLALGALYGYLGRWTNDQWEPASAIFQLERAQQAAGRINKSLPAGAAQRVTLPPKAVDLLATGYRATGRLDDSVRVRTETANQMLTYQRPAQASEVLSSKDLSRAAAEVSPQVNTELKATRARLDKAAEKKP